MTNYNERLDKILMGVWNEGYNRCNQEKNYPDGYDNYSYSMNENQAKRAILTLKKKWESDSFDSGYNFCCMENNIYKVNRISKDELINQLNGDK